MAGQPSSSGRAESERLFVSQDDEGSRPEPRIKEEVPVIEIDETEDEFQLLPGIWVPTSQVVAEIKQKLKEMFQRLAEDAKENEGLSLKLVNMAKVASHSSAKWILKCYESWEETVAEALKERKKESSMYERFFEKVNVEDEDDFQPLLRKTNNRLQRALQTTQRMKVFKKHLEDYVAGALGA